jgi:CBS-domain-containing membrane protein
MSDPAAQLPVSLPVAYLAGSVHPAAGGFDGGAARPPRAAEARRLTPADPAPLAVTDFVWEPPVTVPEDRSIDAALAEMIRAGVRALLVVREDVVTGLVTCYDIQGERRLRLLPASGYGGHDEIEVGHVMTPWAQVTTLDWHTVSRAHVADLTAAFRCTSATHIVLVEYADQGEEFVRGLVSRTRLARQLRRSV